MPPPTNANGNNAPSTVPLANALMAIQTNLKPAKVFKNAIESIPPPTPGSSSRVNACSRHITSVAFDDRGDQG
ncbi:hypothetical protein EDC04DRAFT_2567976 [Pisolithus marmoratus]|nr:hypothetical protein EDC04DRAFT_2567976 [Pisolithus marmoratus]